MENMEKKQKERDFKSLSRYIKKKGVDYFVQNPSSEDKVAFEGILFDKGIPMLSLLYAAIQM